MNVFGIPVIKLGVRVWESDHIKNGELSRLITEQHHLQGARDKAATILRKVRKERQDLLLFSRQQAAMEQEREIVELRALLQQDTRQAIEEAIIWMVDEQEMESHIAQKLEKNAINWAVDTLKSWGAELDWNKLIADRVNELSRQQADLKSLVLYVHPENLESISDALPGHSPLRVEADPSLSPHQALLESTLMRIDIDLDKQFDLLIEQMEKRVTHKGESDGS